MKFFVLSGISLSLLWGGLAVWSNQEVPVPVFGMLMVQAVAWGIVLLAWKRLSDEKKNPRIGVLFSFAVLMRLPSFFAAPLYEDDYFRFLWDGWNFITQGTPYLGPPEDFFDQSGQSESLQSVLYQVNYPEVPTIYPPICQLFFAIGAFIGPLQIWALRLVLLVVELSVLALFSKMASLRQFLLLAWCPLLVFESSFQVHPDFLGASFLLLAFYSRQRQSPLATGVFAALAVGIKVTALPALPFLLWPLHKKGLLGFLFTLIMMYGPFFLQGTRADFDGLLVFTREWEFNASLYAIGSTLIPASITKVVMLILFTSVFLTVWTFWRRDGSQQSTISSLLVVVYGMLFLVSPVVNSWYLLWMIPFVCLSPKAWSVAALALVSLSYVRGQTLNNSLLDEFSQPLWLQTLEYLIILLLACWPLASRLMSRKHPRRAP